MADYRLIAKAVMGPAKRCWGLFVGGGRWMACLEGEKFDQIAALIEFIIGAERRPSSDACWYALQGNLR